MTKTELETELKKQKVINSEQEAQICELKHYADKLRATVKNSQSDIYTAVIERYGKTHQLVICMEEMSELTKEITKNIRGYDNDAAIAEELADVEITLEQLKIIFANRGEVDAMKAKKLARLIDRMKTDAN